MMFKHLFNILLILKNSKLCLIFVKINILILRLIRSKQKPITKYIHFQDTNRPKYVIYHQLKLILLRLCSKNIPLLFYVLKTIDYNTFG